MSSSIELLTPSAVAARLRISRDTVVRWAREGTIPCIRLSTNRLRFEWEAVVAALKQRGQAPKESK